MAYPLLAAAGKVLTSRTAFFIMGAVSGPILAKAAEPVGQFARSLLKSGTKGGMVLGSTVQNVVTEAKNSVSDVAAEVRADIAKADEAQVAGDGQASLA